MKQISLVPFLVCLLASGCTTVVRENIISSVETGVGISLAENPKTELYEVKAGFIRHQFYSVPTGKTVKRGKQGEGLTLSNQADITPELVSGIRTESGAKHLFLGMDVSESFAIGKVAVNSRAATAMYIAQSKDANTADSARQAVEGLATPEQTKATAATIDTQSQLAEQLQDIFDADAPGKRSIMLDEAKRLKLVSNATTEKKLMKAIYGALDEKDSTTVKLTELLHKVQ